MCQQWALASKLKYLGECYLDLSVAGEFCFYKPAADVTLESETGGVRVTENI